MVDLNLMERKQIMKKFRHRKGETALDELLEQDKLINILIGNWI